MTQLTNFFDLVTTTRPSGATRVNALGLIVNVPANRPRADFDPVTRALRGLLIEEARTNLFRNSFISGANLSTQSVSVSAQPHTISFYGTGRITLSGAHSAVINGSGNYPKRAIFTFTPAAGVVTCTVSGDVQFANFEQGSFATSYIPTTGAAATRAADNVVIQGEAFQRRYAGPQSTLYVEATRLLWAHGNGDFRIASIQNNAGGRVLDIFGDTTLNIFSNHTGFSLFGLSNLIENEPIKVAATMNPADAAAVANGGTVDTHTTQTPAIAATRLELGKFGSNYLNGHISKLALSPYRQANDVLLTPENWIEL